MRALLALLVLAAAPAWAARPFVTDDARVVDRDGCQLETFVKEQRRFQGSEFWFLPACNPWGAELTLGHVKVASELGDGSRSTVMQAKLLLKPLLANGSGFAFTAGTLLNTAASPYLNGIGSFSFADDRAVIHANLGVIRDNVARLTRGTWGLGAEVLLVAPRLYGILETYGQRGEKPTLHTGLRIWVVPNLLQVDTTVGRQDAAVDRRFATVGLRVLW